MFKENSCPFTCEDIQKRLFNTLHVVVPTSKIRWFLKNKMWYSYKRWASRPITLDLSRQAMWEALFSVKLSKIIHKFEVIVNIDELAFNRNIKWNYSWAPRGSTVPIWNSCFGKTLGLFQQLQQKVYRFL